MPVKKKKTGSKKATYRSSTRQAAPKTTVTYRRIMFIFGAFVVLLFAVVLLGKQPLSRSVAGLSIARNMFNQATVSWQPVPGAVAYNIYYGQAGSSLSNAVRTIPAHITTYTLSYLKKGTTYHYRVTALNRDDKEFWFSPVLYLNNVTGM